MGAGGKDLITAAVLAYEIQCRFCDAASLRKHGVDHVTYGAISSAIAAGKLMGLDATKLTHAIGIAGVCNVALRQTRSGELSEWKGCAFANAARNGVFAATLAARRASPARHRSSKAISASSNSSRANPSTPPPSAANSATSTAS